MSDVTHIGEFKLIRHAGRGAFADVCSVYTEIKAIEWLSSYLDIPTQTQPCAMRHS